MKSFKRKSAGEEIVRQRHSAFQKPVGTTVHLYYKLPAKTPFERLQFQHVGNAIGTMQLLRTALHSIHRS
jgi:hypothetical protein